MFNTELTMSSREIAELTGKDHPDVLKDIRSHIFSGLYGHVFDKGKIHYPLIQGLTVIFDEHTKRTKEILLNRYHADILVSGYEVKYRAEIIKRWHELEKEYGKIYINQAAEISAALRSITYKDGNGGIQPAFQLSKQATLDLMTGYSLPMRHASISERGIYE